MSPRTGQQPLFTSAEPGLLPWIAEALSAANERVAPQCVICGAYARHCVPDYGDYCDPHFNKLRDSEGRDFGYRRVMRKGRAVTQRFVKYDLFGGDE